MSKSRINSPFSLQIPDTPVTKVKEVYGDLAAIYNGLQILQQAFTDYCGIVPQQSDYWAQLSFANTLFPQNPSRIYPIASENIATGAMVNLFDNAGTLMARNANATNNTKPCHGFAPLSFAAAARGEVDLFNGYCTSIAGLTKGTRYFLSTVNGIITAVAPVAAGNIEQPVGLALSATEMYFITNLAFIQH